MAQLLRPLDVRDAPPGVMSPLMPPRLCYNFLWYSGLLLRVLRAADVLGCDAADDPSLGCPVEYIDLRGTSVDSPAVCKYTGECCSGFCNCARFVLQACHGAALAQGTSTTAMTGNMAGIKPLCLVSNQRSERAASNKWLHSCLLSNWTSPYNNAGCVALDARSCMHTMPNC